MIGEIDDNINLKRFVQQNMTISKNQIENSANDRNLCRRIGEELQNLIFRFIDEFPRLFENFKYIEIYFGGNIELN